MVISERESEQHVQRSVVGERLEHREPGRMAKVMTAANTTGCLLCARCYLRALHL